VKRRQVSVLGMIVLLLLIFTSVQAEWLVFHKKPSPQEKQGEPLMGEEETIVPAPKNIVEATAVYIFLGWIWLSIVILIFFLRLKIKEVDRLHDLGYFSKDKD